MGSAMYGEKLAQCKAYLDDLEIDAWLVMTGDGEDPCIPIITGVNTVGMGFYLFTRKLGNIAVCSSIDAQDVVESGLFDEVIQYTSDPGAALRQVMSRVDPSACALNYSISDNLSDGLTAGRYHWLLDNLKGTFRGEFVSSEKFLAKLRSVKSTSEVDKIQKAIDITLDIYDAVFAKLRVGMTEIDVGQLFVQEMAKRNVVNAIDRKLSMPIVMKERIAHRPPGDAVIVPGDLLIMDFSVDFEGYASDIARTVYFLKPGETEPPTEINDIFLRIHEAITLAAQAIRPGVQGFEVDTAARQHYQQHGLPDITHSTGHQVGRQVHDGGTILGPCWARYGDAPYGEILEGMVLTLEPTVFIENGPGFIVEENVLVTADGARFLSQRQNHLITISAS